MSYPSPYHQTTPLSGQQLADAIRTAAVQDAAILAVYSAGIARTPSQVHSILTRMGKSWPITSIRRGITNLQRAGALRKTDECRISPWGKPEHLWERPLDQEGE
jgi:hypothetical protein